MDVHMDVQMDIKMDVHSDVHLAIQMDVQTDVHMDVQMNVQLHVHLDVQMDVHVVCQIVRWTRFSLRPVESTGKSESTGLNMRSARSLTSLRVDAYVGTKIAL